MPTGKPWPSSQRAVHDTTADRSVLAFLSALITIAAPLLVLPPYTAFLASAGDGAIAAAAAVAIAMPAAREVMGMRASSGKERGRPRR